MLYACHNPNKIRKSSFICFLVVNVESSKILTFDFERLKAREFDHLDNSMLKKQQQAQVKCKTRDGPESNSSGTS
jgi:hypothetical protein